MPKVLEFGPYILFFWIGENGEPVHIHVAIKRPTEHATKLWLTASNHGYICQKWQETFQGDISFYC